MSSSEDGERRRRRSGIRLPEGIREIKNSPATAAAIFFAPAQPHSFALQLCLLCGYGRFLEADEAAPVRIGNHLGAQLDLRCASSECVLFLRTVPPTTTEHSK